MGRLRGQGTRPEIVRPARPVSRLGHRPEGVRDVRLGRVLGPADVAEPGGDRRRPGHPVAPDRPPLLLPRHDPRRRAGRVRHPRPSVGPLRTGGQSEPAVRDDAGLARRPDRLGRERHGTAAEPVPPPVRGSAGPPRSPGDGLPRDPRLSAPGQPAESVPGLRLRPGLSRRRSFGSDDAPAAGGPANHPQPRPEGRCGWERGRRRAVGPAPGPAGHLCRMERRPDRVLAGPQPRLRRGLHPVRKDEGGATPERRPATVP